MTDGASISRIAIVSIDWHHRIVDGLVAGATQVLDEAGYVIDHFRSPGAFDLPLAVAEVLRGPWAGAVALGAIVAGRTNRHQLLAASVTNGLGQLALASRKPVGHGVLLAANEEEALDRAGLPHSRENRGAEAAHSVISSLQLLEAIRRAAH